MSYSCGRAEFYTRPAYATAILNSNINISLCVSSIIDSHVGFKFSNSRGQQLKRSTNKRNKVSKTDLKLRVQ